MSGGDPNRGPKPRQRNCPCFPSAWPRANKLLRKKKRVLRPKNIDIIELKHASATKRQRKAHMFYDVKTKPYIRQWQVITAGPNTCLESGLMGYIFRYSNNPAEKRCYRNRALSGFYSIGKETKHSADRKLGAQTN